MSLPTCTVQYPVCGSCHDEISHDGDSYVCDPCGLNYGDGEDHTEAVFLDPEATKCGRQCENYWHAPNKLKAGWSYKCQPCELPLGHQSMHHHDCDPEETS